MSIIAEKKIKYRTATYTNMHIITVHAISKTIKCIEPQLLEEQISKLTLAANAWIEPMRQWLNQASDLNTIVKTAEPSAVKETLMKI